MHMCESRDLVLPNMLNQVECCLLEDEKEGNGELIYNEYSYFYFSFKMWGFKGLCY